MACRITQQIKIIVFIPKNTKTSKKANPVYKTQSKPKESLTQTQRKFNTIYFIFLKNIIF